MMYDDDVLVNPEKEGSIKFMTEKKKQHSNIPYFVSNFNTDALPSIQQD